MAGTRSTRSWLSVVVVVLLLASQWHQTHPYLLAQESTQNWQRPEVDLNKLASSRGLRLETHQVVSQDRYLLTAHRLVNPRTAGEQRKGLVIIQHGLLCASPFFLLNSSPAEESSSSETSNSLAIELARQGKDVWLTNFRGTQFSRKHLDSLGNKFWNFNVDHLVRFDLKAFVEYILRRSKQKQYSYVGHSLGATVGLGSLLVHQQSELTGRLACQVLMAPVASTQHMRGSLMPLFRLATKVYAKLSPFPGPLDRFALVVRHLCPHLSRACTWLADTFLGDKQAASAASLIDSGRHANSSSIGEHKTTIASSEPTEELQLQLVLFSLMMRQSISVQMLEHIVQVHLSGRLGQFNYGPQANLRIYQQPVAPIYNLTQIEEPHLRLAIVNGASDAISTPAEIDWIAKQVADKVAVFEQITIQANPFNHMDLIMSEDAGKLVNEKILDFFQRNDCFA